MVCAYIHTSTHTNTVEIDASEKSSSETWDVMNKLVQYMKHARSQRNLPTTKAKIMTARLQLTENVCWFVWLTDGARERDKTNQNNVVVKWNLVQVNSGHHLC